MGGDLVHAHVWSVFTAFSPNTPSGSPKTTIYPPCLTRVGNYYFCALSGFRAHVKKSGGAKESGPMMGGVFRLLIALHVSR